MKNKVLTPCTGLNPPVYFCPRAKEGFILDGRIDKDFWQNVPFMRPFMTILGPDYPLPRFSTSVKLCWDEKYLYIAALLEGDEIWAELTERDSRLYTENNFEVFIDPSSSTHDYMEIEVNALNTVWDLLMTRPYRDGGRAVSGWSLKGLETAVHINGKLNDPEAENRSWSVELRLPFAAMYETYSMEENAEELPRCEAARTAPRVGEFWRMNFARTQWPLGVENGKYKKRTLPDGRPVPEENSCWAPTGVVDYHYPEAWGFVVFTENGESYDIHIDEVVKLALRDIYYAEHAYFEEFGKFTADPLMLPCYLPPIDFKIEITAHSFEISCRSLSGSGTVVIRSDSYACVIPDETPFVI